MVQDNLARKLEKQIDKQQPLYKQDEIHTPKPMTKKYTKLEAVVVSFFSLVLLGLALAHIALTMQVATASRSLQDLESKARVSMIEIEQKEQNVQELSRYDRVFSVARQHNLNMNEEQIKNLFR